MNRFLDGRLVRATFSRLCVAAFLLGSTAAGAQLPERAWTLMAAGGIAAQPERQDGHLALFGGHVAAAVDRRVAPGLALRLEGLVTAFGERADHVHGPCLISTEPFECHSPAGPVRLQALTIGVRAGPTGGRNYGALGGGGYRLAAHPTERGRARTGLYGALGRRLAGGRPGIILEAQLHWVPGLALGGAWSAPVRLGMTF